MKNYIKSINGEVENVFDDQIVSGYFTTDLVDVDGHIVFKEDILNKMQEYLAWGNVRADHQKPVGVLVEYNPANWNFFKAKIADDDVWNKVKEGVYKGFSLGLKVAETGLKRIPLSQISPDKYMHLPKAVIDRLKSIGFVQRIQDFYIVEISLTDRPRNLGSVVTYFKSDGSDERLPSLVEEYMENENPVLENSGDVVENEPTITQDESVPAENVVQETSVEKSISIEIQEDTQSAEDNDADEMGIAVTQPSSEYMNLCEKIDVLTEAVNKAFESIGIQLASFVEKTAQPAVDVSKSDALDTYPSHNFDELKNAIVDELKSFVKSEFGESVNERKGTINTGDTVDAPEPLNIQDMPKSEGYNVLANIIAKTIKR